MKTKAAQRKLTSAGLVVHEKALAVLHVLGPLALVLVPISVVHFPPSVFVVHVEFSGVLFSQPALKGALTVPLLHPAVVVVVVVVVQHCRDV